MSAATVPQGVGRLRRAANSSSVPVNMFSRRVVFERVGGSEDVNWGCRAKKLHFRLAYADDAVVSRPARCGWSALFEFQSGDTQVENV
jgi:hypothetical protein